MQYDHLVSLVIFLALLAGGLGVLLWAKARQVHQINETISVHKQLFTEGLEELTKVCAGSEAAASLARAMKLATGSGFLSLDDLKNELKAAIETDTLAAKQPLLLQLSFLLEGLAAGQEFMKRMEPETARDKEMQREALKAMADSFARFRESRDTTH
jgi:hypothetical protein